MYTVPMVGAKENTTMDKAWNSKIVLTTSNNTQAVVTDNLEVLQV